MVLDPLSALGIAAAVVQFVDFSTKLISKGKEIYKSADGVTITHAEQSALSSRLAQLTRALAESINPFTTRNAPTPAEAALREVTLECMQFAEDFNDAINQLQVIGGNRVWKSFRQALKSVWNKDKIEQQLVKQDRLRQQVIIHLLVYMNENSKAVSTRIENSLKLTERNLLAEVRQCNDDMKHQIQALSNNLADLTAQTRQRSKHSTQDKDANLRSRDQLLDDWLANNESSIDSLLDRVQRNGEAQKQMSFQRKVLDSLYFERIDDRYNMVDEKHENTLQWVFDIPEGRQPEWYRISDWLEGSSSIYWVSGKAASGKSTLMKWLLHTDRTKVLLEQWSGENALLIASYFFWSPGSDTQKSLSGLYRSILRSLLLQMPDRIHLASPARWRSHDLELARFPSWTDTELLFSIRTFVKSTASIARICLFIDGLDEFAGDDHQRIQFLDILKESSAEPNIKICVSSRPWEIFKDAFNHCPQLRLEDLTREDIENYINSELNANEIFRNLRLRNDTLCSRLVSEMVKKASGVWLWVRLVARSNPGTAGAIVPANDVTNREHLSSKGSKVTQDSLGTEYSTHTYGAVLFR
ncbi:hypothetical protein AA313_de0203723 [Arthrobotrys entomopaga]|nr:hypothetical protein AA313_de0203723 [Arthrobotrys entomopaga]